MDDVGQDLPLNHWRMNAPREDQNAPVKLDIDSLQSTAMSDELQNKDLHLQKKSDWHFRFFKCSGACQL